MTCRCPGGAPQAKQVAAVCCGLDSDSEYTMQDRSVQWTKKISHGQWDAQMVCPSTSFHRHELCSYYTHTCSSLKSRRGMRLKGKNMNPAAHEEAAISTRRKWTFCQIMASARQGRSQRQGDESLSFTSRAEHLIGSFLERRFGHGKMDGTSLSPLFLPTSKRRLHCTVEDLSVFFLL